MKSPPLPRPAAVQGLDARRDSRKLTRRALRFREAVPDYRILLGGRKDASLDPGITECLERWVDRWAGRLLRDVTPEDVQAHFAELAQKGFTAREIARERILLASLYRWAARSGHVDRDPTGDIPPVRILPRHRAVAWTGVEQRRLLEACRRPPSRRGARRPDAASLAPPPRYLHPLVLLGLRTGLALGNLLHLEWRHVDMAGGRIRIPGGEVRGGTGIDIPLDPDVRHTIEDLIRKARSRPTIGLRVLDAAGLPLWKGRPDEHEVLHAFRQVRRRAGIPEGDFSSLRLTFARNCSLAGVPITHVLRSGDWEGEDRKALGGWFQGEEESRAVQGGVTKTHVPRGAEQEEKFRI